MPPNPTGASPPATRPSLILRLPDAADSAAWEEVVQVYGPLVFRLARKQGLQGADAEDLVQEVFTAVSKQVEQWLQRSDRGPFRAWVLRIARNIAVNALTRRPLGGAALGGSWQGLSQIEARPGEISNEFDSEYQQEVFRWAADQVRQSVAESTWLSFQLTHIDQLSVAQAAGKIGISAGAVYIARCRVMNRLKTLARQFEVQP